MSSDPQRPLPDFVVAGFMKAGTTAVSGWLTRSGIRARGPAKEPDYFSDDTIHARGPGWYATQIGDPGAGLVGDLSTSYLDPRCSAVAAARLVEANRRVRLVVCVRDPLDRAISHVLHDTRLGSRSGASPEEVAADIVAGSSYVERSRYAAGVQPYLETFDPEQILVLDGRVPSDRRWDAIASHLGRPGHPFPVGQAVTRYQTPELRSYRPALARWSGSRVRSWVGPLIPGAVKRRAVDALAKPPLPPTSVADTRRLLAPDVVALLRAEEEQFWASTATCQQVRGDGDTAT